MGFLSSILNLFSPSYKVVCKLYQVVPGQPIKSLNKVESFEKGQEKEAKDFFNKVVEQSKTSKLLPSEIQLVKGKKVVKSIKLGPVDEIKNLKLVS